MIDVQDRFPEGDTELNGDEEKYQYKARQRIGGSPITIKHMEKKRSCNRYSRKEIELLGMATCRRVKRSDLPMLLAGPGAYVHNGLREPHIRPTGSYLQKDNRKRI